MTFGSVTSLRPMWLIAPLFLWALAAVGVPLWLHLTRRRKYREMEIGTLRFLREALRERRRRARFEDIPLLLLRLLAVILLALLFTRPVWQRSDSRKEDQEETVVLLDASGSMTPGMAAAARAAARKAIAGSRSGAVTLTQFSDAVETIPSLDRYEPRPGAPTRTSRAIEWALDHFQVKNRSTGKVILVTHAAADSIPSRPPRVWPPQFRVELVLVEPPTPENAAVRQVKLLSPFVSDEMKLEARVTLPPGKRRRTVTLEAEGLKQNVEVPPGADRVTFHFRPPRPEMRGWVSVPSGDPWPADDKRPFVARWTEPRRVLLVDGRPGSTPFDGQAYFIRQALEASGAAHGKSPFEPRIVYGLEGNSGLLDLTGVGAIALCGVNELSPAVGRALAEFVRKGGGLIVVLDEKWEPGATEPLVEEGLFPEHLALTGDMTVRPTAEWDRTHAALAPFDRERGGDLRDLKWRDGFDVRPGPGWHSLASLDDGHAILLKKEGGEKGAGSVIICAHPLTRAWTDLPLEPLFVPLVRNLFASAARLPPPEAAAEPETPGIHEQRPPGIYTRPDGTVEAIAADSAESLVQAVDARAFRAAFGLPAPEDIHPSASDQTAAADRAAPARSQPGELWPWLALSLCAVLVLENLVATRRRELTSASA